MVDRRYINTLYVTSEGSYVHRDGANVVVNVDGASVMRVPVHMLGSIACFGRISLSPALMAFAFEEGVTITHLSENGRFLARVEGPVKGNVLLRRDQFRAHESPETSSALARSIVIAKATNQRTVVQRALRDHGANMDKAATTLMATAIDRLADVARRALRPSDPDSYGDWRERPHRSIFRSFQIFCGRGIPRSGLRAAHVGRRLIHQRAAVVSVHTAGPRL